MASNRSNVKLRAVEQPASGEAPREALAPGARIRIAAVAATGKAIAGWVHATDRFARVVGQEPLRRIDGETASGELIVRVASAKNAHLRELAALPGRPPTTSTRGSRTRRSTTRRSSMNHSIRLLTAFAASAVVALTAAAFALAGGAAT